MATDAEGMSILKLGIALLMLATLALGVLIGTSLATYVGATAPLDLVMLLLLILGVGTVVLYKEAGEAKKEAYEIRE